MTDLASTDSTAEQSKQAAADVAGNATSKAGDVAVTAKEEARSVAHEAKSQAANVLGTARDELRTQASEQAKTVSATLSDLGRQLGDMADGSNDPQAQVAQLARSAADTLSQRASRIDADGIDGVIDDLKRVARNRPGAFLLGSIAAGFAIGRLAKHADLHQTVQHAKQEVSGDSTTSELSSATSPNAAVPVGTDRIGSDPLGTDPLGAVPVGTDRSGTGGFTS